ncbi:hypothetical protein [Butyrivibrio sp. VCB2001]|uniref:hypothetical protein n=1 Tax=Butyrivibrio sp. VCB2001 TaxID=1280667 RepID=UPI0003F55066|nr:hypothetical protein [Butyrivibrio sp. VCB2001]
MIAGICLCAGLKGYKHCMEMHLSSLYKKEKSYFIVIIISLLFCIVSVAGGELDYAGGDDYFRNLMSVGAFGDKYCYYIPYSNVLYGIPIAILNRLLPWVDWYYLIMIIMNVSSIVVISEIIAFKMLRNGKFASRGFIISIAMIMNLIMARDCYISIQYTRCAALWIATGILCMVEFIRGNNKNLFGILLGIFFFFIGAACRIECLYMCIPFLLALAVILITKGVRHEASNKNIVLVFILLAVSIVIIFFSEWIFRNNNPEWRTFWEYDKKSTLIRDFYGATYDHDPNRYDEISTDENDLELFRSWMFADTDFFTVEWYDKVALIEKPFSNSGHGVSLRVIGLAFINLIKAWNHAPFASKGVLISVYLMILLMCVLGDSFAKIYSLLNLGALYVVYGYFTYVGRFMWRAEYGAFITLFILMILYFNCFFSYNCRFNKYLDYWKLRINIKHIVAAMIVASTLVTLVYSGGMIYNWLYIKDRHVVNNEADITGRLYSFNQNDECIYAMTDLYISNNPMSITREKYHNTFRNVIYLCGWLAPTPTVMETVRASGIENPMRALVEEDNFYLYSTNEKMPEIIRTHLQKTLNKGVEYKKVSDVLYDYFYTS